MTNTPLHIPKRYRDLRQGCYVVCYKNGVKKVTDKCCQSGKKISTCKHGENHRFQSKVKNPYGSGFKQKNWPKEVRDLNEFLRLHLEFKESLHHTTTKPIDSKPGLLSHCLAYYVDFLNDVNVPSYERKRNSKKHIDNQVASFKHMMKALRDEGIEPNSLPILSFTHQHVAIVHDYIEKNFANKTYNDKVHTYQAFFDFLIRKGYQVSNLFKDIKRKHTEARKEIVTLKQFQELRKITTKKNGLKFEKKGGGRVSQIQMHRGWLVEGWEFALFSGCRRSEITMVRMSDIMKDHIVCRNEKVSNLKDREVIRLIPLPEELRKFIEGIKKNRKHEDYLIAPGESNRHRVGDILSKSFSHYWNQLPYENRRLNDLRNTYATAMLLLKEQKRFTSIGLHGDDATTRLHYGNELELIKAVNGQSIFN